MAVTKFVLPEFKSIIQEELIDTNFVSFGEGLEIALSRYKIKTYKFPNKIMETSLFCGDQIFVDFVKFLIHDNL